jgi:transcription elongation factor GreA
MEKEPITSQGLEKLKKELENLKNIKRPKIVKAIAEARAHGDLKENAEYHAAKEEQSKIEGRIIEINNLIAIANVIDVTKIKNNSNVIFGSTVYLLDLDNNEKKIYKIVGKDEADIKKNFIYFRSPIGNAIIGKNKKDFVTVKTPSGEKNLQITEIKYI